MERTNRHVPGEGEVLWTPSEDRIRGANLTSFMAWLRAEGELDTADYPMLWQWSVDNLERFWESLRRYFGVGRTEPPGPVLVAGSGAEGAAWFPGLELNYVDRLFGHPEGDAAVLAISETGPTAQLTFGELRAAAGAAASGLARLGVGPGDRVAAVVTNSTEAIIGFLATASLGAVWSSCAPEFGVDGMLDRFTQIAPKALIISATYHYGGTSYSLADKVTALEGALPGLAATIVVADPGGALAASGPGPRRMSWDALVADPAPLVPLAVPFDHPLWILYSSGTTGLPKPIVHGHGGIVLEHLKSISLHCDLGPGDRFFWFSTTGWMMWNFLVGGLLAGATVVCYDGSPAWPDQGVLWRMAHDHEVSFFGTSAPFIEACRRAGMSPRDGAAPVSVRTIGSTGSPLSPEGFGWAATEVVDDVLVASMSGGTDVCTGFLVSSPLLPVRAGEIQCRALGAKVESFDDAGRSVVDVVGELVVTTPMPSMPLYLWGDPDGQRLHETYFEPYPGVWRHGDWLRLTPDGGAVIYGRSDATLNRGGVRTGTAEFYRVVEGLPEVADSLVVDTTELGREGQLVLFVVPAELSDLEASGVDLEALVCRELRSRLSPRHVPDVVLVVPALPRTVNGKKLEVPVRRILLGEPVERAVAVAAVDRPEVLGDLLARIAASGRLP